MMKRLICLLLVVVATCRAAPQDYDRKEEVSERDPILTFSRKDDGSGKYAVDFTSKNEEYSEVGELKQLPGDKLGPVSVKSGYFTFVAPNHRVYKVTYTSDEKGFLAKGEHLPTSPPIPQAIQDSLDFIRQHGKVEVQQ